MIGDYLVMAQDPIELLFGNKFDGTNLVFTPTNIAEDMIKMLPEDFWTPDIKLLDIYCKTGRFLKCAYNKLFNSPYLAYMTDQERKKHILSNQLYGICDDNTCVMISQRLVYGILQTEPCNIVYISKLQDMVNNKDQRFFYEALRKELGTMQFDVVIGNPPYNKGMDLDFVDLGFKLSKQYTVMITPAKWQTASASQSVASKNMNYEQFRKMIVPHISKVCFYPDCSDIFNIGQIDGITYYLTDKGVHDKCQVRNVSRLQKAFNNEEMRDIRNQQSLINIGNAIYEYISKYKQYNIQSNDLTKRYKYSVNQLYSLGGGSPWNRVLLTIDGKCKVVGAGYIVENETDYKAGVSQYIFSSDNKAECESFVSWLNCKLIRFMLICNVSKLTVTFDDDYFRFVPAPPSGKFDHIYTDQELYQAFNLPQKYIDVIEAVIKERK